MRTYFSALILFVLLIRPVAATSEQAYRDYLYQFDVYRTKNSEFSVAKSEYLKFKTLTSQTIALEKTKAMMAQRALLLRAYLLLLNEKINQNRGMTESDRTTYQTLIRNEVVFLESHSKLVESIGSLEDAQQVSRNLVEHDTVLQASMRQTIAGIILGNLSDRVKQFDIALADAKAVTGVNRGIFSPEKQTILDRWLLQITNTRSLYQQKVDTLAGFTNELRGSSINDQNQRLTAIQKTAGEARQYLLDGSSNLGELTDALKYQ